MSLVAKTLAILVALFFLLGAIVTAAPGLFGGSKVRTLFSDSQDALAGGAPPQVVAAKPDAGEVRDPLFMHATKAGPMPVPRPVPEDAGDKAVEPKAVPARPPVFFPASKSAGGLGLPEEPNPAQQAQP